MNRGLLAEMTAQIWAMEPKALEAFFARLEREIPDPWVYGDGLRLPVDKWTLRIHDRELASAGTAFFGDDEETVRKPRMSIDQATGVATIPVAGVLLKKVPGWVRRWGIDASGYDEIEGDVRRAADDPKVSGIRLLVESPGGMVSGLKEAADAIWSARGKKRVSAEIREIGASAAYWLAAQAQEITANLNAQVGSIGVYSVYADYSQAAKEAGIKIHVVASGPHKGMGVPGSKITDEQLEAQQQVIDRMASNFKADVLRSRKPKGGESEWASGRVWLAEDAAALNLIDGLTAGTNPTIPSKASAGHVGTAADTSPSEEEETVMAETTKPAAGADVQAERAQALAAERERAKAIRAAFPENPDFALAQIEAGSTLDQAKAAFADVLRQEKAVLERENADLKAKAGKPAATKPDGAPALRQEGEPGTQPAGPKGFLARAEELARERKWTKTEAMSHLARTEPGLYEAYMREIGAGAIFDRRREVDAAARGRR